MIRTTRNQPPIEPAWSGPISAPAPEPADVALVTIAAEIGVPIGKLADRLGDDVLIDERTGLRCVSVETCRRLLDARAAEEAEEIAKALRRREAAKTAPRPKPQPLQLEPGETIYDLMLADAALEQGPRGFDRYLGPNADSGAVIRPPRPPRRKRGRKSEEVDQ